MAGEFFKAFLSTLIIQTVKTNRNDFYHSKTENLLLSLNIVYVNIVLLKSSNNNYWSYIIKRKYLN